MESTEGRTFIIFSFFCFYLLPSFAISSSISPAPAAAAAAKRCTFPAIFNFGDSNSDTGGLAASALLLATPPYGETFFHRPEGRFCDGRLVIDFIANSLGLPYLSAYLDSMKPNFTHGVNFATVGSTIRQSSVPILPLRRYNPFDLEVQRTQFTEFQRRSRIITNEGGAYAGLMPRQEYFSKALYTFDIGQNDLLIGLLSNMSLQVINASIPDIINHFQTNVMNLYELGARYFWIHNMGPIGCLPYMIIYFPVTPTDGIGCAKPYNELAQQVNHRLKEAVTRLRKKLPLAALIYVDVYLIKYSLFTNPVEYGFGPNPLLVCCGNGGKLNFGQGFCGDIISEHGKKKVVGACQHPSRSVMWDGAHFTEAANRIISHKISTGAFSDPPIQLIFACHQCAAA